MWQLLHLPLHHVLPVFAMEGEDDIVPLAVGGAPPAPPGPPGPPGLPPVLPPVVQPLQDMGAIGAAVNAIALDRAPIISVLEGMAARMDTLTLENRLTKQENALLLTAARKAKVASTLAKLTNPMSMRAVTNNFRILHIIEDILITLKPNGQVLVPVSLGRAAATIEAQVTLLEEISRILQRDSEVHQIAKDSHVGWSLLPYLDEEETATEEKDSLKLIKSKDIAAAEKSYMTYTLDKSKTSTFTRGGAGRGVSTTSGKGKGKGKGRGRGKSPLNGVAGGSVGKSSKPRTGGCHRCGGPHFVRSCTVAVQKPAS